MDVVHALSSSPSGPPGRGEWGREEAGRLDASASSLRPGFSSESELLVLGSLTAHLAPLPLKPQKVAGS